MCAVYRFLWIGGAETGRSGTDGFPLDVTSLTGSKTLFLGCCVVLSIERPWFVADGGQRLAVDDGTRLALAVHICSGRGGNLLTVRLLKLYPRGLKCLKVTHIERLQTESVLPESRRHIGLSILLDSRCHVIHVC